MRAYLVPRSRPIWTKHRPRTLWSICSMISSRKLRNSRLISTHQMIWSVSHCRDEYMCTSLTCGTVAIYPHATSAARSEVPGRAGDWQETWRHLGRRYGSRKGRLQVIRDICLSSNQVSFTTDRTDDSIDTGSTTGETAESYACGLSSRSRGPVDIGDQEARRQRAAFAGV